MNAAPGIHYNLGPDKKLTFVRLFWQVPKHIGNWTEPLDIFATMTVIVTYKYQCEACKWTTDYFSIGADIPDHIIAQMEQHVKYHPMTSDPKPYEPENLTSSHPKPWNIPANQLPFIYPKPKPPTVTAHIPKAELFGKDLVVNLEGETFKFQQHKSTSWLSTAYTCPACNWHTKLVTLYEVEQAYSPNVILAQLYDECKAHASEHVNIPAPIASVAPLPPPKINPTKPQLFGKIIAISLGGKTFNFQQHKSVDGLGAAYGCSACHWHSKLITVCEVEQAPNPTVIFAKIYDECKAHADEHVDNVPALIKYPSITSKYVVSKIWGDLIFKLKEGNYFNGKHMMMYQCPCKWVTNFFEGSFVPAEIAKQIADHSNEH